METLFYVLIALTVAVIILLLILLIGRPWKKDIVANEKDLAEAVQAVLDDSMDRMQHDMHQEFWKNEKRLSELKTEQAKLKEDVLRDQRDQSSRIGQILTDAVGRLQQSNEQKLEQMRQTVDEKLTSTLNERLDQSFKSVSERLEKVHYALGEMQKMGDEVSNLQRLLTNVKARGTWAEVQLGNLLEQTLTQEQFVRNFSPKNNSEHVEFAIKLPSRVQEGAFVYLPIDSKFPTEAYQRIQDAAERADADAVNAATKELAKFIRMQAAAISEKYLEEPITTSFAILFLPTEGLYAEVLRIPGLSEEIQDKYRVMVCGPTTITAFLNTVRVGFKMITLDQRASEVWDILGAVKKQYGTFHETLEKAGRKIEEARDCISNAQNRTEIIQRKMQSIEEYSSRETSADELLGVPMDADEPANEI